HDQFATSMNEFMANINNGVGGSGGASGSGGVGGSGGTGGNVDETGVRGKANVVAYGLSRRDKEPIRVRALVVTVHNNLLEQIRSAQAKACKKKNIGAEGFVGNHLKLELMVLNVFEDECGYHHSKDYEI
nr:putative reverse transcriptase domain-containing protein [Tanacetum cinerariifolium]